MLRMPSSTVWAHLVSCYLFRRVPVCPPQTRVEAEWWNSSWACLLSCGGSPGPGERGCVQGLINHGHFGRDKQARPSRDAAAPAAGGGVNSLEGKEEGCGWFWGGGGAADSGLAHWGIHNNTSAHKAAQACKSTFLLPPVRVDEVGTFVCQLRHDELHRKPTTTYRKAAAWKLQFSLAAPRVCVSCRMQARTHKNAFPFSTSKQMHSRNQIFPVCFHCVPADGSVKP